MVMPLFVGRAKSISALDEAMNEGKQLLLVSQKQADLEEPTVMMYSMSGRLLILFNY